MHGELVLDASVAAKFFITEDGSDAARRFVTSDQKFVAPDLLLLELASIAAKRFRRGDIPKDLAIEMVKDSGRLADEVVPAAGLIHRAFQFALQGFSAYDGVYLALAEQRGCAVLTVDSKLLSRAQQHGVADLVVTL
jgi:predicted nucleic acid-binding protein